LTTMDAAVATVLQAALEKTGPPPGPPVGDVQSRRVTLDAILEYFNNQAQPPADDVKVTDHEATTATTPDPNIAPLTGWSYDDNATGWNALLGAGHERRDVDRQCGRRTSHGE
jgi:hypothetical protein